MQEDSIFLEALEKDSPEARSAFLDQACAGNAQLRAVVEQLLRAHERADKVLPEHAPWLPGTEAQSVTERVGIQIGPYKLLEQIGEGGMGTVFVAQQTEPIKRLVALKIIKPGMDSRQVIARFEAERQALALMEHPNIARVLDAGTTESGRPYFVMELVKGVPITQYCDQHHLTPRQRLELFVPVCQAIQHAHQKGIIHRDLKPSNVLVALYDNQPVPKVIDFGVAKATGQQLTDQTLHTGFGAVVGTVEYMSPEQATLNQLDIDTRSDIYSLGVLLYELLAGSPPFTRRELEEAGMLEMLRVIREREPSKPSTKLSSSDALPTLSANRGTEPGRLMKLLRGELDWIVMKALEKDRSRRYETATGFAMDLQRYLADEPVMACPPSATYRLQKFAQRNKRTLATAVVIGLMALLSVGAVAWALRDRAARAAAFASQQEERRGKLHQEIDAALREAATFRERALTLTDDPHQWDAILADALSSLVRAEGQVSQEQATVDAARQERVRAMRATLDADETDRHFAARFEEILMEQSQVRPQAGGFNLEIAYAAFKDAFQTRYRIELGSTSAEQVIAVIRGRPKAIQEKLIGALDHSLFHLNKSDTQAREWLTAVLEKADADPWRQHARQALSAQDWPTVEKLAQEPAARNQPWIFVSWLATSLPRNTPTQLQVLRQIQHDHPNDFWANYNLACTYQYRMDPPQLDKAIRYHTAALAVRQRNPGACVDLAGALRNSGDWEGAVEAYRDAVAQQPDYVDARRELAIALNNLGLIRQEQGDLDEAIECFRESIKFNPNHAFPRVNLGNALKEQKKLDEAITCYQKAIDLDPNLGFVRVGLCYAFLSKRDFKAAIAAYRNAVRLDPKLMHPQIGLYLEAIENNPKSASGYCDLGNFLSQEARWNEAIAAYRHAIEIDPKYAEAYNMLAWRLGTSGPKERDLPQAVTLAKRAVELAPTVAEYRNTLGLALQDQKNLDEAIESFEAAIKLDPTFAVAVYYLADCLREQGRLGPTFALTFNRLGIALWDKGDLGMAIAAHRRAIEIDPQCSKAHNDLAWCLATVPNPELRDLPQAVTLAKQAVELAPKVANYHNTLGVALKNQNRFEEAIASFQEAIRCEPNFFWPHYNLAWLLATCPEAKFRDPAKAMEFAETAGRLKGNRGWYLRALGAAQYRADQWQAAVESLTEADKVQNGAGLSFYAFFLAMAHGQLGHAEEAHQWLSKAVEWMEKYAKDDPELICFRAEAEALLGNKQPDRRMRSSAGRRHRFLGWPSSPWRIPATFLRLPACGPRTDSCRDSDSSSDAAGSTGETSCVPLDVDWPEFWLRQHFWPPE